MIEQTSSCDPRPGLLRIGTRGSALAVAQTSMVAEQIATATGLDVVLVIVTTHGDTSRAPLSQLGGTGVFVSALRDALAAGACDIAVHSLKDLPTAPCPGISLGAVPLRVDARDALCSRDGQALAELPHGAKVGTGSPRRVAQLLVQRPDLDVHDIRGNVDTRLARTEADLDAVVLACAGLDRLGRGAVIAERFPLDLAPSAPGQGALAIEVRTSDLNAEPFAQALAALEDSVSRATALAERAVLATLEAGCAAPVGATATVLSGAEVELEGAAEGREGSLSASSDSTHASGNIADQVLRLRAAVYSLDGSETIMHIEQLPWAGGDDSETPERLGRVVAEHLLAQGAARIAPLGERP